MGVSHCSAGARDRTGMGLPPRDFKSVAAEGKKPEQRATASIDSGPFPSVPAGRDTISRTPAGSVERGTEAPSYPVLYSGADFCRTVIYGLVDPREPSRVRYVGKAQRGALRFAQHFIDGGPGRTWFSDMGRDGVLADMVLLEECDEQARGRELHWFTLLRDRGEADLNVQKPLDRLDFASDEDRGLSREKARALLAANDAAFPRTNPRASRCLSGNEE